MLHINTYLDLQNLKHALTHDSDYMDIDDKFDKSLNDEGPVLRYPSLALVEHVRVFPETLWEFDRNYIVIKLKVSRFHYPTETLIVTTSWSVNDQLRECYHISKMVIYLIKRDARVRICSLRNFFIKRVVSEDVEYLTLEYSGFIKENGYKINVWNNRKEAITNDPNRFD